jgi:DNA-binding GntR family transcriptional regulator
MQLPRNTPSDGDIHDHIFHAILARRLRPGERLIEAELAQLFGVSRTKVRGALARLAQDGIVEIRRNQGASVAAPSKTAVREVIEFRCMVEPAMAAALARRGGKAELSELREHVKAEQQARAVADEARLIRLTGEFHLKLAALHGNRLLERTLREAEALMTLGILRYGRPSSAACLPGEHRSILLAIAKGDEDRAAREMTEHLRHIEAEMDLSEAAPFDLGTALRWKHVA